MTSTQYLSDRKVQTDDLVVDEQLHAVVILQESHQLTVLTNLVFDISHQRPQARLVAAVRVAQHATLHQQFN